MYIYICIYIYTYIYIRTCVCICIICVRKGTEKCDVGWQAASETVAAVGAREGARAAHGLPPDSFLIANFNNLDKLEPR
jgi:hypothetical protein